MELWLNTAVTRLPGRKKKKNKGKREAKWNKSEPGVLRFKMLNSGLKKNSAVSKDGNKRKQQTNKHKKTIASVMEWKKSKC